MTVIVPSLRPQENYLVANAIRTNASTEYRRSVPAATQANVQQTMLAMWDYVPLRNEFISALVNRIGMEILRGQLWSNPLGIFKMGMLPYGDTIEEVAVDLAQAYTYDFERNYLENILFGQEPTRAQSFFHKINRQEMFKVTVNETGLKRAFTEQNGLWNFVAALLQSATNADQQNEFLTIIQTLQEFYRAGGFFKVNVPDVADNASTADDARSLIRSVRGLAGQLQFLSKNYNPARMPVFANPDKLIVLMTPESQAAIDVEALAAAFNIDRSQMVGRTIILPFLPIPGAQAILTTSDLFVIADTLIENREQQNAAGLYTNHFLHHHGIISLSPFVPAILFTTEEGDVIPFEETPVTGVNTIEVADGTTGIDVTALVRGQAFVAVTTAITEGDNDGVRYELVSKTNGPLSVRSKIEQTGVIIIAKDESSTAVTINAYALDTDVPQLKATLDLSVVGTRIHYWPFDAEIDDDADGSYEVLPDAPTDVANLVTIPDTEGVIYKKAIATGVTFTDAGDIVTVPSHAAPVNTPIVFGAITTTTGVVAGTVYYVKTVLSANTFTVSAAPGGAVLALTTNGSAASATFTVAHNSTHPIVASTTFTAAADTGGVPPYELAAGATTSWTFVPA